MRSVQVDLLPCGVDDRASDRIAEFRGGARGVSERGEIGLLEEYNISAINVLFKKIVSGFSRFVDVLT